MNIPIVSVVMSVYNGERFLQEAVQSILDQSFQEFELIVIDDGSTDGSAAILNSYQKDDPRVQVYHQENKGLVESLNSGCKLARGKYIARMDADDIAMSDRLALQVDIMEKQPDLGVVGGAMEVINAEGDMLGTYRFPASDHEIKALLIRGSCPLLHPAVLIRTEALRAVGAYRPAVADAEDYDLWLRMAEHFQLANLDAVILKYRRHAGQVSVRKCRQQALSNLVARTAALSRRNGRGDPLEGCGEITPSVLARLGLSDAKQKAALARGYVTCIQSMVDADENSFALDTLNEMSRSSEWGYAENWVVADLHLLAARLYWRQKRLAKSLFTVGLALMARPLILARPLKPLLYRLGLIEVL